MDTSFKVAAEDFMNTMPYREKPYSNRNWGHTWHSLCSYNGKLKPAIAHMLVERFTDVGDVVLDPMCGVGTIPFEACLQGRLGIGNDLSEMAYVVSKAKLEKPDADDVACVLRDLENCIKINRGKYSGNRYENFGLNGMLPEYFEENTYEEILIARQYFLPKIHEITSAEAFVYSALLHILHGNRPYALSRRSHPLTPYAPRGDFEYKSLIGKLSEKIDLTYNSANMVQYVPGRALWGDYANLTESDICADAIICSPPFADSIKFYTYNWMRLWMCGWEPEDFKSPDDRFLENMQRNNFDVYYSFFEMCGRVLKKDGRVILHLGKTKKTDMARELSARAAHWFETVYTAEEPVEAIEKHGIKDKGGTIAHQYLFLQKK